MLPEKAAAREGGAPRVLELPLTLAVGILDVVVGAMVVDHVCVGARGCVGVGPHLHLVLGTYAEQLFVWREPERVDPVCVLWCVCLCVCVCVCVRVCVCVLCVYR